MFHQVWLMNDGSGRSAKFKRGENPLTQKSVHAFFFGSDGKIENHYILRSSYIRDNYSLQK